MALAIFDIDGTLVAGPSTERRFIRWLIAGRHLGARQLAAFAYFLLRWAPRYGAHTLKKNKAYLSGLDTAAVDEMAHRFVAQEILTVLHAPAANRLREHLTAGDHVMLLSGTLTPIARALGQALGVDDVLATHCVMRAGRYLAAPPTVHPFGSEKRVLLESVRKRPDCANVPVYAYADSHHDLALLEAVDVPVCVLPDARLQACALERGWQILGEQIELPATLD